MIARDRHPFPTHRTQKGVARWGSSFGAIDRCPGTPRGPVILGPDSATPRKKLKAGEKACGGILFVAPGLGLPHRELLQEAKHKAAHSELEESRNALLVWIESFITPQAQLLRLALQVAAPRLRSTV